MKVLTESPVRFAGGGIAGPPDFNRPWLYAQRAIEDVSTRRFSKGIVTLPFVETMATPYTQATPAEERIYRFRCPIACVLERVFLNGNMTVAVAPANWSITKTTGGTTPSGATTPLLSTRGATLTPVSPLTPPSVSSDGLVATVTDVVDATNPSRVLLEADTEYQLALTGTTFSMSRADVTLHVTTDRWQAGGAVNRPAFTPSLLRSSSPPDATVQLANQAALATEAAKFASLRGMTPILFVRHGLATATDADLCTFSLPRFSSTRAQAKIVKVYLWAVMAAVSGAGIVQVTVAGNNVQCNVNGVSFQSASSATLSTALSGPGLSPATPGDDLTVVFANSSVTNCLKVYCLVWVAWS